MYNNVLLSLLTFFKRLPYYDPMHRVREIVDGLGNSTRFRYDLRGNLISTIDPKGSEKKYSFDLKNRLTKEIDPLGKATEYQYDALGNRATLIAA